MEPVDHIWYSFQTEAGIKNKVICPVCGLCGESASDDVAKYKCPNCESIGRDRLYWIFLQYQNIDVVPRSVLHITPERCIRSKLKDAPNLRYKVSGIDCDFSEFDDGSIDLILCNYMLDRVKDTSKILSEFNRILSRNGLALLSVYMKKGASDLDSTPRKYNQADYVSLLESHGFIVNVTSAATSYNRQICSICGINPDEKLVVVRKKLD